jgi:O-antigen/teichoic acid export membrane protein
MGISQGFFVLVQFIASVIIARLLTPTEVGVYVLALSITGILGIIQSLGLTGFIVREVNLTEQVKQTTFTINMILNLAFSAAIGLGGLAGESLFHQASVARVLWVLALIPLLGIFEFLPAAMTERAANFRTIAMIAAGRTAIAQSLTVVLAFRGFSSQSFAYGQLAGGVFSLLAYNLAVRSDIRLKLRFVDWWRVVSFGAQMLTINGANAAASRMSEMLLARFAGLDALGLFSRAAGLNNLAWENIHLVMGRVLFVRLASLQKDGLPLRDYYLYVVEVLTALLWPAFIGLAVVSRPFILAVYGPQWLAASYPLVFLALASVVNISFTLSWELFVVCGETRRQAKIELVRTAVGTGLFAAGAALGGLTFAAAGRLGDALFSAFMYRGPIGQMTATRLSDFRPIYIRSLLLTAVAVAPAAVVMFYYHGAASAPLVKVAASVAVGIVAWVVCLTIVDHPLAKELWRLIGRIGRRA